MKTAPKILGKLQSWLYRKTNKLFENLEKQKIIDVFLPQVHITPVKQCTSKIMAFIYTVRADKYLHKKLEDKVIELLDKNPLCSLKVIKRNGPQKTSIKQIPSEQFNGSVIVFGIRDK